MEKIKLILLLSCVLFANDIPLGRNYSLSSFYSFPLELNKTNTLIGLQETGSIYNTPCLEMCKSPELYRYKGKEGELKIGFLGGYKIRNQEPYQESVDMGIHFVGNLSSLFFSLDARTYAQHIPGNKEPFSHDGEFIEVDNTSPETLHENLTFARFRTTVEYQTEIGNFFAARNNVHWGPALYTNFLFHQDAVPFNHFGWKLKLGPFRILTLVGKLFNTDDTGAFIDSNDYKTIYAHRYEIHFSKWAILALNEQLLIKNGSDALAFVPFAPLFMEKGQGKEEDNNGNLSVDLEVFPYKGLSLYTELFIDDLEDPAKIFDDHWKSKWAWSLGMHYAHNLNKGNTPFLLGNITEYSRIEPWVYTHHRQNSAQSTHRAKVLGNQSGPHSQDLFSKLYLRWSTLYFGLTNHWSWKGVDEGSQPYDVFEYGTSVGRKEFLKNSQFDYSLLMQLNYTWKHFGAQLSTDLTESLNSNFRIHFSY